MCLIICQMPLNPPIPLDSLQNAWKQNKDGAGIMYVRDGALCVEKRFAKLGRLVKAYQRIHALVGKTSPIVIHFRWATHGPKSVGNCHPFYVGGPANVVAMAHNGVLPFEPEYLDESDTVFFARTVLAERSREQLMSRKFADVLATMIGEGNKLVFMDVEGEVTIVNEEAGHWHSGAWYSGYDYLPDAPWHGRLHRTVEEIAADPWGDDDRKWASGLLPGEVANSVEYGEEMAEIEYEFDESLRRDGI